MKSTIVHCLSLLAFALAWNGAPAQDVTRPLRIVTMEVGGGADFVARVLAQGLNEATGQPVIVDNRSFALLAIDVVTKSPPNGNTLYLSGSSLFMDPLFRNVPYDPITDLAPISTVASAPTLLVVHPSVPAKSVSELIVLAKEKPAQLNYGSAPPGSTTYLAAELFKSMSKVDMVGVMYKGAGPLLNSLVAGEIQLSFPSAGAVAPHLSAGRLRGLAVTSAQRSMLVPELPTVAASGLPGYQLVAVYDLYAPAKTPAAAINRINQDAVRVLATPGVKERYLKGGVEAGGSTPQQLIAARKADVARIMRALKDVNVRVQ